MLELPQLFKKKERGLEAPSYSPASPKDPDSILHFPIPSRLLPLLLYAFLVVFRLFEVMEGVLNANSARLEKLRAEGSWIKQGASVDRQRSAETN
jgi:hypothetical protein